MLIFPKIFDISGMCLWMHVECPKLVRIAALANHAANLANAERLHPLPGIFDI